MVILLFIISWKLHINTPCPLQRTTIQNSIHCATGGKNSPHENPEEYKNEIPMDFIFIFFQDET